MSNHSFVIRIWLEEIVPETGELKWRGHIIHLPSHTERYFDQLQNLLPFIESCLKLESQGGEVSAT
jgi:hypothetical protein